MQECTYLCPSCKKPALIMNFRYMGEVRALRSLQFPYVVCSDCRLYDLDKKQVRLIVSAWKRSEMALHSDAFTPIFTRVLTALTSCYQGDKENPPFAMKKFICTKKPH